MSTETSAIERETVKDEQMKRIAIIGMSCVFAGADDVTTYWQNILNKVNALGEVPRERWDPEVYFDSDRRAKDKVYSKWGGFIGDFPFDPTRYGMPPNSVPSIDPLQLVELRHQMLVGSGTQA